MDATINDFKKTVLFLSLALLCLGLMSPAALAQPITTCGTVSSSLQGVSGVNCTLTNTTNADLAFTTTATPISYNPASPTAGGWLGVSPNSGTVPANGTTNLTLSIANAAGIIQGTTYSATVTVTPAAGAASTFTFNYTPGSSGGGGTGTGLITATPFNSSLLFCPNSSQCNAVQYVNLTTTSTTPISFTVTPPTWLTVYQISGNSGSVSSSASAQLALQVNNFSAAGATGTVTISYTGGPTTFTVQTTGTGSGSGALQANPTSVPWSYVTNGTVPSNYQITLTETGSASYWSATATPQTGDPVWVNLSSIAGTSTSTGYIAFSNSSTFTITPIAANFPSLSTGVHTTTITITDTNSNTATVLVTVTVNSTSTNNGLTISPGTITLPSVTAGTTSIVSNTATITSTTNSGNLAYSTSGNCPGISVGFSSTAIVANGGGVTLNVYGNPTNLAQGTYTSCAVNVNLLNGSQATLATVNVPLIWQIGTGSSGGGNGAASNPVLPTALNFVEQNTNTASIVPQSVQIAASGSWTAAVTYSSAQTGWITVGAFSGVGPGTTTISVNPASVGLGAGTYTGTVTFTTPLGAQAVTVTLFISASPVLYANPGTLVLTANGGILTSGSTSFQVLASDGSAISYNATSSVPWMTVGATTGSSPGFASFTPSLSTLANGTYVGAINFASGAANTTLSVPVVLTVTGSSSTGGYLSFSSSALTFNAQVNGASPAAQTFTATAPSGTSYTVAATTNNGGGWLIVSPAGFMNNTSQTFTVTATQSGLPVGTYTGTIGFQLNNNATQTVGVTMYVTSTGTTLSFSPTSLSFSANQGGATPATQTFTVSSASGASGIGFSLASSATWLTATASGTTTPATITVTANPSGLAAQTYTANVVVTPSGGSAQNFPVTFVVSSPAVTASPTSINLQYAVGGTAPTSTITVGGSGSGGAALNYTTTVTSTCNCIAINPTSGTTTANPTITVSLNNPTTLTAGSYTGTITVSGTSGSTGNTTISVNLTVTAPLPTILSIANAASGATGAISPGEIVSIFGSTTNPIGPTTAVSLTSSLLTSSGNVPTTMGGVTVTFNGRPAPLLYVSATQINAVVPYGVAGFNNFPVIVSYLGQTSNGFTVQTTTTVPGIFTQNGAGSGPAAVLNADGVTANGPNSPAPKGSTVAVFMTGEGATTPAGVDGKVTCGSGCSSISQIPIPLLPVSVLVDGQPATVVFYGEAPSLVSGVMQVNFTIPAAARSGSSIPLVISVGGNQSQQNVTIAVQ